MAQANKHIAMWTCPRSRSTAITRAFDQLDECLVYDEPLTGPYLLKKGYVDYPPVVLEDFLKDAPETDYAQIIKEITGNLPSGKAFSFQKRMSKYMLPEFDRSWIKKVHHFFIIRDPKKVIFSYWKANQWNLPNMESVGFEAHYHLFQEIEKLTGKLPLVIDAEEFAKKPETYLKFICTKFELTFSPKMLKWEPNPKTTRLRWKENTSCFNFYSQVINSTGFKYQESEKRELPEELSPLYEKCLPFYENMLQHRIVL